MISYKYIVSDKQGLHATNATSLSRVAAEYESRTTFTGTKGTVGCKNVLALMSLGAGQGGNLEFMVERSDEGQASDFLKRLMRTILQTCPDRRP